MERELVDWRTSWWNRGGLEEWVAAGLNGHWYRVWHEVSSLMEAIASRYRCNISTIYSMTVNWSDN